MKNRLFKGRKLIRANLRTRFLGLFEQFEERLPLSGSYTNALLSSTHSDFLSQGTQGLSGMGDRVDQTGESTTPLGPFKNRDGSPVTPGMLGPFGRTIREEIENPISDYFDATPVDQRSTDSLIAHLGSFPAYLSIEGGFVDGTIDEIVFDVHIQRKYELNLLDIEFESEELLTNFYSKNGIEANLSAIVEFELVFGISLDPSLNASQAFFIRDYSISSSIRADSILHPFEVNFGFLEASVPDVLLAATLDLRFSQPLQASSLRLTEIDTLDVAQLFTTQIGANDFAATFNLEAAIGRWRLDGSTYLQATGDFLGFDPAITLSPNFDEIFLFNNVRSSEIVAGIETFQSWLTSWGNTSEYDVNIPFTRGATARSVINPGSSLEGFIASLRDDEGNPSFDNAQDFPYSGSGLDYDPESNKLTFTVIQALPGRPVQSRDTRVELDDTVGLGSQTEAIITGSGTVSFVLAIDISASDVDFRDRISIEHLQVRTFYGTEAVVLTGNAAFGGLGLSFANAVLSGEISTIAFFRSVTTTGAALTLRTLNNSVDIANELLENDLEWSGEMTLRLPSLSVVGNLFGVAADSYIEISVSDIKNSIYETITNVPDFLNFESLSFLGLASSLSEAVLGTEAWDSDGNAAVATLGLSLEDFGPLKQGRIAEVIQAAMEVADSAPGFTRSVIQDINSFVESLEVSSASGVVDFVSNVAYDIASGTLSWLVDVSADESTTISSGLGFESLFDFTSSSEVENTDDLIGDGTSLPVFSSSRLVLGFEFDPTSGSRARGLPNVYLNSQSRLDRKLFVNAGPENGNAVVINGASGAIGMQLRDGTVVIAQNLASPDQNAPAIFSSTIPSNVGRIRVSDLGTYIPDKLSTGRLRADFEVVPKHTGNPEPNRLAFRTLNLSNPIQSTTLVSSPNFPQIRDTINLQVDLNAFVPSVEKFFQELQEKFTAEVYLRFYPLVGDQLEQFTNFIAPIREAFTKAFETLTSFSAADIENAIEFELQKILNPNNHPNRDYIEIHLQSPSLFKLRLEIDDSPIAVTLPSQTNLGVPALGIKWDSEIEVIGTYDFGLTFALDVNDGFYIETNTDTISMTLDMDMVGQASGTLGFFEVTAFADAPLPAQRAFHAQYELDLDEPSGDDRLFLDEIGVFPLFDANTSGLTGEAHMQFTVEAVVNEWLPSIETGLRIDWIFDGFGFQSTNPPEITYFDMRLNLGRLLNETFLPFFEAINRVFEPMQPIIDLLTNPLPVISDFSDPDPSILSLALLVKSALPEDIQRSIDSLAEFIETIDTINEIVQAIQIDSSTGLSLQLGNLSFGGSQSPMFDARSSRLDRSVLNLAEGSQDLSDQFSSSDGAPNLASVIDTAPGMIQFPIIQNPLNAIGWILGFDDAELITWDLPNAEVSFPIEFEFPIFPGIMAGIFGGLEVGFDFKVGLDTTGFEDYVRTRDFKDLFNGFYVSDRINADGTGADVNEVFVRGDLLAGAGVGISIAGVGVSLLVGGGVFSEVGIDLIDHDKDGKIRGRDFNSPDGCFSLNGEFGVALEARAKVGIFKFELPITEATLANGRNVIACPFYEPPPPAILAGLDSTSGTLTLFVGPESHNRNVQSNVEEENFTVLELPGEIIVSAFGRSQSFPLSSIRKIVADAGTKDDRITMSGVTVPSILRGGDGDDILVGGESDDFLIGGVGRDELRGNGGDDTIIGEVGSDLIFGDAGDDDLYGNEGDDDIHGGSGADDVWTGEGRNLVYGDEGDDRILGGSFKDIIYGGLDNDTIEGGDGPDVLNGDEGIDTIRGQSGNDLLDGGSDDDFLYGDEGDDTLWGRRGIDVIYGGSGADYLNGNEDGDYLYGQADSDELNGESGDDSIDGGPGNDLVYGESGIDTIRGGLNDDIIDGGEDGDDIAGGDGNDVLLGAAGDDTIRGGSGDDTIDGGSDDDSIYGFEIDLLADSLSPGITDRDFIDGGRGNDRVSGGPDNDKILGSRDADTLVGNEGADEIDGGSGSDSVYGFHLVTLESWLPVTGGLDQGDWLYGGSDLDRVFGGPGNDFIRGNSGNDFLYGDQDEDLVFGDGGDDTIEGGGESDEIDGGEGNDTILGGGSEDQLYGNIGNDRIEGNRGSDTVSGNDGNDYLEGNEESDLIYGGSDGDVIFGNMGSDTIFSNEGNDLVYGDEGEDTIEGGAGNDTLRGGDANDFIRGDDGADLIMGYKGDDTLLGDEGDDVIYGGEQNDTIEGGEDNDRIYGEIGDDTLSGDQGNDVVEGGSGDDTIFGDAGNDALYGDKGEDAIFGGDGDDFLFAGDGVSNYLNGDDGNDVIVGSDDGDEDPKFGDTTFFGDRLNGGDGDDLIDGLGGADEIDGGIGNNTIRGGTHIDQILNGVDASLETSFQMPLGPDRRGRWAELSRSASYGGLSNVGGLEESVYVDDFGVYVAWVDWRNGNTEIYVAYHPFDVGVWTPLVGFNGLTSASGGGVSNDEAQSRRPTLFKTESNDSLVVAWTSIAADGSSTIEVAREDSNWNRVVNPGQTGSADEAKFVQFGDHSGLLFWIDTHPTTEERTIAVSQYVFGEGCIDGFLGTRGVANIPSGRNLKDYDAKAVEFQAVVALSYGDSNDQDIVVRLNNASLANESAFCPGVPNVALEDYVSGTWSTIHTIVEGDVQKPTVGIQYINQRGFIKGEIELEFDVGIAWEISNGRENQVDGLAIQVRLGEPVNVVPITPKYDRDLQARVDAETISDSVFYSDKPSLDMSYYGTFLAWKQDSTIDGDGNSNIFVLGRYRDTTSANYVVSELNLGDASGDGISATGNSLRKINLDLAEDGFMSTSPVVVWNEGYTELQNNQTNLTINGSNVYLRVTLDGLQATDDKSLLTKFRRFRGNVLSNDKNLDGEVRGFVSQFDNREFEFGGLDTIEFTSPLGALVIINKNGDVTYDPRGVSVFRALGQQQYLSESFVYRVDNFIHRAEGVVEFVVFGTNSWQNAVNPVDVDDDKFVSPLDVLFLINDINANGARLLDHESPTRTWFLDVDDDGSITPLDVLAVINWLNNSYDGEGEENSPSSSLDIERVASLGDLHDDWITHGDWHEEGTKTKYQSTGLLHAVYKRKDKK